MTDEAVKTLYIADDEPDIRTYIRAAAEAEGWRVVEAANGHELVHLISTHSGDGLIILDMMMPEMDGIETVLSLGDAGRQLPVVIMSGGPSAQLMAARKLSSAAHVNLVSVLTKPFKLADLKQVLRAASPSAAPSDQAPL